MKYYKAFEQTEKPFITWHGWANSLEELTEMGEFGNPLIVAENHIPAYIYGICPWKIQDGELVERTEQELLVYENEYNIEIAIAAHQNKINLFNTETFEFDGSNFLMDQSSHLYYLAIDKIRSNYEIIDAYGQTYNLLVADIDDFLTEYYTKIILLISPNKKV